MRIGRNIEQATRLLSKAFDGGGGALDGSKWAACKLGFFVPVRVLSKLFRRLMLEELEAAQALRQLTFLRRTRRPRAPKAVAVHLAPLRKKNWFAYAKPPLAGPRAVLVYLPRYTHRVAISNRRLVALDADRRHVPIQGLPPEGAGAIPDHDPSCPAISSGASCSTPAVGLHRIRHHGLLATAHTQGE